MIESILIAVPATIGALAAWRASRRTHKEVQSPNGVRSGEMLFRIAERLDRHIERDEAFQDRMERHGHNGSGPQD